MRENIENIRHREVTFMDETLEASKKPAKALLGRDKLQETITEQRKSLEKDAERLKRLRESGIEMTDLKEI